MAITQSDILTTEGTEYTMAKTQSDILTTKDTEYTTDILDKPPAAR
jgi:hypothetical protein